MGVIQAMVAEFQALGSSDWGSESHVPFHCVFPPTERQVGNEAQGPQQEESTGRWRYDKVPGGKERFQPLKTLKQ